MVNQLVAPSAPKAPAPTGKTELLKQRAIIIGASLGLMWALEIIDAILGQPLNQFGIVPRTASGLAGIPFAPILHADFGHLLANTLPFALLGFFTTLRGISNFFIVTAIIAVAGGLGVWIFGSNGSHIGASGLIFGYFGYNVAMGIFERSLKSIALAVLIGLLYGSMIFGVLPGRAGVSWEGHLFGAAAGVAWAWYTTKRAAAASAKK